VSINRYVGSPVERTEDLRLVRGRGTFIQDIDLARQWHAVVLRSPIARGTISHLDKSGALQCTGVNAVLTGADLGENIPHIPLRRPFPAIEPYRQPVIARDVVRYVGEPVAVVLADTCALAEDALEHIALDITPDQVVAGWREAVEGPVRVIAGTSGNVAASFIAQAGDVEAAFGTAAHIQTGQFRTQRQTALPMECRGLLAQWDEAQQKITMSGAAKLPFFNRRALAGMLGLAEHQVDYVEYDVGGGFGARGELYPEDFLVAFAARNFGRPIKWVEDRREHLTAIGHARECDCELAIAFAADGKILGLKGDIYADIGAYMRPNGTTAPRNAVQCLTGPYDVAALDVTAHAVVTNKTPAGSYRGPGFYEACFFIERLLDKAAAALAIDPLAIRRRNFIARHELPRALPVVQPDAGWDPFQLDSGDYGQAFDMAIEQSGWKEKARLAGKLVDGRFHGLGVAPYIDFGVAGALEHAHMRLHEDGRVVLSIGSSGIGQGIETIMAQIAADVLEIPMQLIEVRHGSTTIIWNGVGSFGSRATVTGGCATLVAGENLLAAFRSFAASRLGVPEDAIQVSEGRAIAADGRRVTFAEAGAAGLEARGTFDQGRPTFAYGTAVAHVAVVPGTGHIELVDYTVVDDVGRIINPATLHGQSIGAAVQGLGAVFGEELVYDEEGQLLVGTLADYEMPLACDYPHIHFTTTELHPSPFNPLGAKGAGEGGIVPVAAAIANAVANALASMGVQPDRLPLAPHAVWQLIDGSRRQSSKTATPHPG